MNSWIIMDLSPVATAIGWTLVNSLWQFTLLALIANIIIVLLPHSRPQSRYIVLFSFLLMALIWSGNTFCHKWSTLAQQPSELVQVDPDMISFSHSEEKVSANSPYFLVLIDLKWQRIEQDLKPYIPMITAGWLLGLVLSCLYVGSGLWYLRYLKTHSRELKDSEWKSRFQLLSINMRIKRGVDLRLSDIIEGPVTFQFFKPIILIPIAILSQLTVEQVEALLLHELAHIRRHDFVMNMFQVFAETIFFYHPAIWWLSSQIREEREHCCDQLVLSSMKDPHAYANALIQIQLIDPPKKLLTTNKILAMSANHNKSLLSKRVHHLFGQYDQQPLALKGIISVLILGLYFSTQIFFASAQELKEDGIKTRDHYFTLGGLHLTHQEDGTIFVVNGKINNKWSSRRLTYFSDHQIKSVSVLNGEAAIKKYGPQAKYGAVEVWLEAEVDVDEALRIVEYQDKSLIHLESQQKKLDWDQLKQAAGDETVIEQENIQKIYPRLENLRLPMLSEMDTREVLKEDNADSDFQSVSEGYPMYVIDGVIVESIPESLTPEDIHSINVWKEENAVEKFGSSAKFGAIEIFTKAGKEFKLNSEGNPMYVIDGVIVDSIPESLNPEDIHSINVWKEENAVEKFGPSAKFGAIEIFTKADKESKLNLKNDLNGSSEPDAETLMDRPLHTFNVFPNPSGNKVLIKFSTVKEKNVKVAVFSLDGRLVKELINESRASGTHQISWEIAGQESGVYLIRMEADDQVITNRIIVE